MKLIIQSLLILFILMISASVSAQSKKKYKGNKRTSKREIRKRQQKAYDQDQTNAFNPIQPRGARQNDARDDLLWHSESANTVYHRAGNLSLVSPSRYGIKPGLELSTNLFLNYWVPNITLKKRWANNKWYIASKHGFYSATPGFHWAKDRDYNSIVDSTASIPFVLSMKNELIFSRLFARDNTCSREQPYLILSAGVGIDYGYAFGESGLSEIDEHVLTPRSPALTGKGGTIYSKIRADWQINNQLMLGAGLRYFYGEFTGQHAFEQSTELQTFLLSNISISIGYLLSYGHYNTPSSVGIIPLFDLTWHFGRKQGRQKGLFKEKMY